MSRSRTSRPLGDVLESLIDRLNMRPRLDEAAVVNTWRQLAGPEVCDVMDGAWVQGHTFFVRITSAACRQDLHLNRSSWRDRLNERLGAARIQEIVFR